MSKKICIVGGAGFIGHNLAIKLSNKGYEILIIDSLAVNNYHSIEKNLDNIPNPKLSKYILDERMYLLKKDSNINLLLHDARDYHLLCKSISDFNPNVLIQLAAVSHANRSNKDPFSTFDNSLRTLENALDACKKTIDHFIFFSSSMVYGNFETNSVNENSNCNPIGIYGALKLAGEILVKSYGNVFDLPYTIVRPSALYGERCVSRRVGQIFIENALTNKPITIKGDGSEELDFTYIDDLTNGIALIIENEKSKNEIFNLTYGKSNSVKNLVNILKDNFENIKISYEDEEPFTPKRGTLDISKARDILGYKPQNSIEQAYPKYINWYKNLWENYNSHNY